MNPREQIIALQAEMAAPGFDFSTIKRRVVRIENDIVGHQPRVHDDYLARFAPEDIPGYWAAWLENLLDTIAILEAR